MIKTSQASVSLHIERLVLHGFDGVDARRLGAALRQELQRRLEAGTLSLPGGPCELERLDIGRIALRAPISSAALGRQAAAAVCSGLHETGADAGSGVRRPPGEGRP